MSTKEKIYLIDWYNFIYRLFYAIPSFTLKDWTPINTVFWLAKMILWWHNEDKPDYLIFILDHKWKKIREEIFAEYKWTRDRMPSELKIQESLMMQLLEAFNIPTISLEWYEADDIIWTLATKYKNCWDKDVYILSWDKDLFQFIWDNIKVYDTMKRKIYLRNDAFEKFWVYPEHIVDYLSICWDSSDNIPWIPWFWPKKAGELIWKYWSLENIYENLEEISWKSKDTLIENKEIAFMSKKLASIHTDLKLENFSIENHKFKDVELINENVIWLFKKFEFKSLIPEKHKDKIKNFDSLWIKIKWISSYEDLLLLSEEISLKDKISISTYSKDVFNLDKIYIYTWEANVYMINVLEIDVKEFLSNFLENDKIIISYELKDDLKRIQWYLYSTNKLQNQNLMQASLF